MEIDTETTFYKNLKVTEPVEVWINEEDENGQPFCNHVMRRVFYTGHIDKEGKGRVWTKDLFSKIGEEVDVDLCKTQVLELYQSTPQYLDNPHKYEPYCLWEEEDEANKDVKLES